MALEREFKINRPLNKIEDVQLRLYYNNLVLYHLVKINHKAFMAKARKGTDDFGRQWKPLKPKTVRYKRQKGFLYGGTVAINIRTRELLEAMKPGQFRNGVYIPVEGQEVEITPTSISFAITVEYADLVHSKRKILVPIREIMPVAKKAAEAQFITYLKRKGLM
jgi:hypothetical protein